MINIDNKRKFKLPIEIIILNGFTLFGTLLIGFIFLTIIATKLLIALINKNFININDFSSVVEIIMPPIFLYFYYKYSRYFEKQWILENINCFKCGSFFSECDQYTQGTKKNAWKLYCPNCKKYYLGDTGFSMGERNYLSSSIELVDIDTPNNRINI